MTKIGMSAASASASKKKEDRESEFMQISQDAQEEARHSIHLDSCSLDGG